jgi:hypothetical protein
MRTFTGNTWRLAAAAVGLSLFVACGSDDGGDSGGPTTPSGSGPGPERRDHHRRPATATVSPSSVLDHRRPERHLRQQRQPLARAGVRIRIPPTPTARRSMRSPCSGPARPSSRTVRRGRHLRIHDHNDPDNNNLKGTTPRFAETRAAGPEGGEPEEAHRSPALQFTHSPVQSADAVPNDRRRLLISLRSVRRLSVIYPKQPVNPYTVTISSSGIVSPKQLTVPPGTRVLFVNNQSRPPQHDVRPAPGPPRLSRVEPGGSLNAGQSRESGNLVIVRTCGFHDHDDPDNVNLRGSIIIR